MSGGFYQRYIPPTPKKPDPGPPSQPKPQFFTRYVPPADSTEGSTQVQDEPAADHLGSSKVEKLPRREKKKTKAVVEPAESEVENDGPGEDSTDFGKHQRLQEKFVRAQKRSEKARSSGDEPAIEKPEKTADSVEKHGLVPIPQPVNKKDDGDLPQSMPLPDWMAEPIRAKISEERSSIYDLQLSDKIEANLKKRNFETAFAVQETVIPLLLPGKTKHRGDVCVAASTGSGKTFSYVLPMVEALQDKPVRLLRGLIVVPTRELVSQVKDTLDMCSAGLNLKVGISVGNRSLATERKKLMERQLKYDPEGYKVAQRKINNPTIEDIMDWDTDSEDEYDPPKDFIAAPVPAVDIIVCTPGRLVDHLRSTKGFNLHHVQWLVIDEADKLLDQSFQQWVDMVMPQLKWVKPIEEHEQILRQFLHIPQRRQVQKVILSATMTSDISKLLSLELKNPKLVVLEGQNDDVTGEKALEGSSNFQLPPGLSETAVMLGRNGEKPLALVELLEELMSTKSDKMDVDDTSDSDTSSDESSGDESVDDGSSESAESTSSSSHPTSDSASNSSTSSEDTSDSDDSSTATDLVTKSSSSFKVASAPGSRKEKTHQQKAESSRHGVLVFANTNEAAQRLSRLLGLLKPDWKQRIGTLTKSTASSSGRRLLNSFRSRNISILVASDRASRGLDIENLSAVVNYDPPTSLMNYVHRVGRTARAGQKGAALTLVSHHEGRWFWNEIGKTEKVTRAAKVSRREDVAREVSEDRKEKYEGALKKLGKEARGSR